MYKLYTFSSLGGDDTFASRANRACVTECLGGYVSAWDVYGTGSVVFSVRKGRVFWRLSLALSELSLVLSELSLVLLVKTIGIVGEKGRDNPKKARGNRGK